MHARLLLTLLLLSVYAMWDTQASVYYEPKPTHRPGTMPEHVEVTRRKYIPPHKQRKKDIFLSRGWGAGGMPFSVLYMNPTRSTVGDARSSFFPEAPRTGPVKPQTNRMQPLARNALRNRHAKQQAIPQLFVSYNWAPMGRRK